MEPSRADPFLPLVATLRTAAFILGTVLAGPRIVRGDHDVLIAGGILVTTTVWQILHPLRLTSRSHTTNLWLLIDLSLTVTAIAASGRWESPYLLVLTANVVHIGLARGYAHALSVAAASGVLLTATDLSLAPLSEVGERSAQSGMLLALTAVVGGYARQIFLESEERRDVALENVVELGEANRLLTALYQVTQTSPGSLDLHEALVFAKDRLRELIDFTVFVVLVRDSVDGAWRPAYVEGVHMAESIHDLPAPLAEALASRAATTLPSGAGDATVGIAERSGSGIYAPLETRGVIVGLLAIEHEEPGRLGKREVELIEGSQSALALAIDNAEWFSRIYKIAAEEERARIARDLHDSVAQTLASVSFEMGRVAMLPGDEAEHELPRLRDSVQRALADMRETLSRLRTKVTDTSSLVTLARRQSALLGERTGIQVDFSTNAESKRLNQRIEQEVWQILQEALTNIERHAGATQVWVSWTLNRNSAHLEISDNGHGFDIVSENREGAFGITGMRERARAIGARLVIDSTHDLGTSVTMELDMP